MWALPVLHPAYTFRQPAALGPLAAHVEGFVKRVARGFGPTPKLYENPSVGRLRALVAACKRRKLPLSVDVESAPPKIGRPEWALLPAYARLRAVGCGAAIGPGIGLSWFFPCNSLVWAEFKRALADPTLAKLFANGFMYDIPILERYGCKVNGEVHDIKHGRRALSSTARCGLGAQAGVYLTCGPWKAEAREAEEEDDKGLLDAARIPREKLLLYNAEDTVRAAQIRVQHRREFNSGDKLERTRLKRLYSQQRRLAHHAAAQMHLHGFPVDEKRRRSLAKELSTMARDRANALVKLVRPFAKVKVVERDEDGAKSKGKFRISMSGGVNESDLRALIYRECARPGIESFNLEVPLSDKCRTETGQAAVNKRALLYLFAMSNLPAELRSIIKLAWQVDAPLKARSTYVESERVLAAIGPDGRIHPAHNPDGTETGRFSCSRPNLYNLSEQKKEEEGAMGGDLPNIRDMYVAPPGWVIVHRDFSQLELEVMQDVTGDALLRRMLATGDAHTARVHEWFNVPLDQPVPKMLRRQGKVIGFNSQYGGGVESVFLSVLEQMPDADFEDIEALHALFPEKHVGIKKHWEDTVEYAETHGYQFTRIMDRRIYYPPGFPLKPTETSNYPVQGTAADIANCSMVGREPQDFERSMLGRLKVEFPDAWLAMHTYDSFDVICRKRDAKAVDEMMNECMSGPWKVGAKAREYKSDGKVGRRWSEV